MIKKLTALALLIVMTGSLVGCGPIKFSVSNDLINKFANNKSNINFETGTAKSTKTETHDIGSDGIISKLNIDNTVGDVNISRHSGSNAIVDVEIKAFANTEAEAKTLIDNFVYTVTIVDDTLVIDITSQSGKTESQKNISVDLNIKLPESVKLCSIKTDVGDIDINNIKSDFDLKTAVGDIEIKSASGTFVVNSDVGDVDLSDCSMHGDNKISSNIGDVDMKLKDISDSDTIKVKTEVGDIDVTLPADSSYIAQIEKAINDSVKKSDGTEYRTKINLNSSVGEISIN